MTALSVLVPPTEAPSTLGPVRWRGMLWVIWRQHRVALGAMGLGLGALAAYLWVVGVQLHHTYAAAIACHPAGTAACTQLTDSFNGMTRQLWYGYPLQPVPALMGAFIGAPVVAREVETGTFRFAWAQGFQRWRWALAKFLVLGAVVTAAAGALSLLTSWYYQPYWQAANQAAGLPEWSPFAGGLFDLRGVGLAAWTMAAFAIGALVGTLIPRVVPALLASVVTYAGLALAAALYLRQHYLSPLVSSNPRYWATPGTAWVLRAQWVNRAGRPVGVPVLSHVLQGGPPQLVGKGGVPKATGSVQYLMQHGYTVWTTYQPASRFWPFQWTEAGWLLLLSALMIAGAVWLVHRRTA